MWAIVSRECGRRGYVAFAVAGALVVWAMAVVAMKRALSVPPYFCGGRLACSWLSFWTPMWARFGAPTGVGLVSRVRRASVRGCTVACCSLAVTRRPQVRT